MMHLPSSRQRRHALRIVLASLALAGLAACGRKGDVIDLRPPPPPAAPPAPEAAPGTTGG